MTAFYWPVVGEDEPDWRSLQMGKKRNLLGGNDDDLGELLALACCVCRIPL